MNNFAKYITPKEARKIGDTRPLKQLRQMAKNDSDCHVCGQPVWKFGDTGMCFTCTTGETDASSDYELVEEDR